MIKFVRISLIIALAFVGVKPTDARAAGQQDERKTGQSLFEGQRPLKGKMHGQSANLASAALKCSNCHALEGETGRKTDQVGPPLGPGLKENKVRHNGPAFGYYYGAFCKLLREGKTPTDIVLDSVMPRFEIDNDACFALWRYLAEEK